jgi:hypothetical protein
MPQKKLKSVAVATVVCGVAALFLLSRRRRSTLRTARKVRNASSRLSGNSEPPPWLEDVTIHLEKNPSKVNFGEATVVSWSVHLPGGASALHIRLNGKPVAESDSLSIVPPRTMTITLSVSGTHLGLYSETSQSVEVAVDYPPRVVIDPSTPDPEQVLVGALVDSTNREQIIELCDVDLDLTGFTSIVIGDNRSLIASPDCARSPRRFGPLIFVTDKRGSAPLFEIRGDNVLFSGFRLEGPTRGIAQGDDTAKGIHVSPWKSAEPIHNIEICNMEIFHWSGAGIDVRDNVEAAERGRLYNTNPGAVRIRGNYIHHNRHAGLGYGVVISAGAYATIEQNVFDENRHAIAGESRNPDALDYSGYTARDNLILAGGGLHCSESWYWALTGWHFNCWYTHQIDMHGDQNEWYSSSSSHDCGTAGETIIIERNTILYTNGLAIKIRGNPADKAVVDGNVFTHESRGDAIAQNGACGWWGDNITNPIDVRPNNQFGVDPMAELGSGDFFGDGQEDQFMATGVTWWAKSPVTLQWRYLNTMSERLPQLMLVKVDNDAVCDVRFRTPHPEMIPTVYSKSGTGPWEPVQVIKG